MFFGCIPIVSNIPQHREIMSTNALYFDFYEKSLTIAIKKAMEIPSKERLALRLKGHKFVTANYGEEAITQKWASLLKKLQP
jgi:glycosyltransferase involved in cell wall biosynthesis